MRAVATLLLFVLSLLYTITLHAQDVPAVPDDSALHTQDDYTKYEPMVLQVADWLEETNLDADRDTRRTLDHFIYHWVTGSPKVRIVVNSALLRLMDRNQQLSMVYLARYASWCIQHNDYTNAIAPTKAALLSILKVYQKDINVRHTRPMEHLARVVKEDELDVYINREIKPGKDTQ